MPKFTIEHSTNHSPSVTYEKLKAFLSKGDDIKKFDSKATCSFDDKNFQCQLKGSQFKADVSVAPAGQGTKLLVTVDLPLLLSPFKGKIQESLTKMLTKYLV